MKPKKHRLLRRLLITCLILLILGTAAVFGPNLLVKARTAGRIYPDAKSLPKGQYDCILVLGAGVEADGSPSHMLEDRLLRGIELYHQGAAPKLLMSGDHGTVEYDEVNTMKQFAIAHGVPSEDIFMDHAGFSTYESMYRAKEIFGCERILVVTQQYHLYRALFLADSFGMENAGVSADLRSYWGQTVRYIREILARDKDVLYALVKPLPTWLGDPIDITGNGDVTND